MFLFAAQEKARMGKLSMKRRMLIVGALAVVGSLMTGDLLACGDKFLMASRGTRLHPAEELPGRLRVDLRGAHGRPEPLEDRIHSEIRRAPLDDRPVVRATVGDRSLRPFRRVLAGNSAAGTVERLVGASPDGAIVVAVDSKPKDGSILKAIDKAVEQRDKNLKKLHTSS